MVRQSKVQARQIDSPYSMQKHSPKDKEAIIWKVGLKANALQAHLGHIYVTNTSQLYHQPSHLIVLQFDAIVLSRSPSTGFRNHLIVLHYAAIRSPFLRDLQIRRTNIQRTFIHNRHSFPNLFHISNLVSNRLAQRIKS